MRSTCTYRAATPSAPFTHGTPQSGGLGFGPTLPGDRFACPGGAFVGASVVADLDYVPHRCIFAPPPGNAPLRLRFADVRFGHALHGHHALYVEAERDRKGAPVTLSFKAGDAHAGHAWSTATATDGSPSSSTRALSPARHGELVAEISSPGGERRLYCFEADTR